MATQIQVDLDLKIDKLAGQLSKLENTLSKSVDGTGQKMGKKVSGDLANSVDGSSAGKKLASEMSSQGSTAGMSFGKMFSSALLANLATAGIQSAISGIFSSAFTGLNLATNFESQLSSIKALTGATGDEMIKIKDTALEVGKVTSFSAMEAAQGLEELLKAGLSTEQGIKGLRGAMDLASAGGLSVAESAEIASVALNAFKADNLSVSQAADILAGGANASATSVQELKFGLSQVSAIASGVGLSFKDVTTGLALFAQNGLKGSDAGTSLKTMLLNLQPSTKAQVNLFRELGLETLNVEKGWKFLQDQGMEIPKTVDSIGSAFVELAQKQLGAKKVNEDVLDLAAKMEIQSGFSRSAFFNEAGQIRNLAEISEELKKSMSDMTDAQRLQAMETLFGTDAIRAANILFKEGADGINNMAQAMGKFTAVDVAREKMNNLKGTIETLKGTIETSLIQVFSAITPQLKIIFDNIQGILEGINFETLGQALSTGIQFITSNFQNLLGVLGSLASGGVVGMIISAFTTLSTSIASAGGIATVFGATMATIFTPINLAIAGISLAVFGLYQAWTTNFGGIQQIAQQVFQGVLLPTLQQIQIAFQQLLPALKNLWSVLSPLLLPALKTLGLVLGGVLIGSILVFAKTLEIGIKAITNFANWLTSAIKSVVNFSTQAGGSFQSFWSNIQGLWTSGLKILTTSWNNTWKIVSSTLAAIFLTIVAIFTGNTQQLSTIWSAWLKQFQTAWSSQWKLVSSIFTSIFTAIVSSVGSYLSNLYNSFVGTGRQVVSYLSTLDLTSIGKNMIQGLINGVQSMAGALMSTMKNMAQNAINSAKETLKIHSPSRVFTEIGQNIPGNSRGGVIGGVMNKFKETKDVMVGLAQGMTGAFTKTLSSGVLATGMIGSSAFGTQAIVPPTQTTTPPTTQRVNRSEALGQGQADQIFNQRLQATQPTVNPQENEQAISGMGESVNTLIENLKTGLPEAFKLANESIAESLKQMDETITEITNMINENWIAIFTGMGGNIPKSIVLGLKANERLAYSTVAGLSDNVLRAVGAEIKGREKGEDGWANRTQSMSYPQIELARNFKTISVDSMAGTGGNVDNSRNINFGNVSVQSNSQMEALAQKINSFSY